MDADNITPTLELLREDGWTIDTDTPSSEFRYKHAVHNEIWDVLNVFDLTENQITFAYSFSFEKEIGELGMKFFMELQNKLKDDRVYLWWDEDDLIHIEWTDLYPNLGQAGSEKPEDLVAYLDWRWRGSDQLLYSMIEILRLYLSGKAEPEVSGLTTKDYVTLCLHGIFPGVIRADA